MIPMLSHRNIVLVQYKVDFRRWHDGLLAECYRLSLDPYSGDIILFIGRCRRRIKLVFADGNGLWVAAKRFDGGALKTKFRFLDDPTYNQISRAELAMFIEGNAFRIERRIPD